MNIDWLEMWYSALASPHGVAVAVSEPAPAKQALYRARAKAADPHLDKLQIRTSVKSPDDEIWIVKGPGSGS